MKWHVHWPAGVLALVGIVFFAADRLTRTPTVVHAVPGQVIEIPAARDGHYYLQGAVNGVPLRFMIDTGATYVSWSAEFARKANLPEGITGYFSTANGNVEGRIVKDQVVEAEVQAQRVGVVERVVADVGVDVGAERAVADRVLADEPAEAGVVVAGPVVVQAGLGVELAAGVEVAGRVRGVRLARKRPARRGAAHVVALARPGAALLIPLRQRLE